MHELGIVYHIMDSIEQVAKENEVTQINKVVLELGEMSSVVESYLRNCWKWASKSQELFIETELIVEPIPAIAFCESCEKTYEAAEHGKICPYCGSMKNHLLQGDEFNIKEIEVV